MPTPIALLKHDKSLAHSLEQSEAIYWGKLYDDVDGLKPTKLKVGTGIACALPGIDILAMNRVIGWGWKGKKTQEQVSQIIDFYDSQGCLRFFIQLSPWVQEREKVISLLQEKGFRLYNSWSKLWRPISGVHTPVNTFLEVREIGPDLAEEYGRIIVNSFDWEDLRLIPFLAASVGKPGYRHYLLYDGQEAIGAGALHLYQQYASMAFAATLPEFRGKGGQALLIHQRIRDAAKLGANYLVAETAVDIPEAPSKSFRNLQKLGFDLAYQRENWILEK